jgi:serine/threonine protein kinase/serine phosphatase RsbU (regulator of sigma subunit)
MKTLEDWLVEAVECPASERDAFVLSAPADLRDDLNAALSSYMDATGYFDALAQKLRLPTTTTRYRSLLPLPEMLAGTTIAHYRILSHIGDGGMGAVYRAEDTRLGRTVALKFLGGVDGPARDRFVREAQSASALDHPNICTIFEIGDADGRAYISMACYEGQTLRSLIDRGPLDVDSTIDIIRQTASGLAAAHAKGIVHRDIKPENLMILPDGRVIILDFGLAKGQTDATVTQEGTVMGTAAYMSPEQATGRVVDFRSDIWSLGAVLYEMLAGDRPFPGAYPQAVLYGILNADPEPLSGRRAGLPLQLVEIVDRMLQKEPDNRFSRLQEVMDALQAVRSRAAAKSQARERVAGAAPSEPAASDSGASSPALLDSEPDVLHLLCVDDEPELELLMQQRFRKNIRTGAWKFVFALDGQDALNKLEQHPEIGVILTDLNMPRMDGLTLLSRLSELDRPLRTVVVSAYGDLEKIRTAMNRGAFDFVTKPIDFADLETTVDKAAADLAAYRRALRGQNQAVSIQQEMDVARRIQDATLPVSFPDGAFGFSSPAGEINSTFYDAFDLPDGRVGLVTGEVQGRGVTSTLLLAMGQTFMKGLLQQGVEPATAVGMLNSMLFADDLPNVALHLLVVVVSRKDGAMTIVNADHLPPFLLSADGDIQVLDGSSSGAGSGSGVTGPAVWAGTASEWTPGAATLPAGGTIVLPSRGCVRAIGESGHPFSVERLAATLREAPDSRPTAVIRSVLRAVGDHVGDAPMREDLTLVAMQREA